MSKKVIIRSSIIITVTFIISILILLSSTPLNNVIKGQDKYNTYMIDVTFDDKTMQLEGSQTLLYTNHENIDIENIYFHLYPNAYRYESNLPIPSNEITRAYPDGFSEGYIDIKEVKVNKETVFHSTQKEDVILLVELNKPIKPNRTIKITIKYIVQIPPSRHRFGYGDNSINLTTWYPILCVYDQDGWNIAPYYPIGDPFYSDISNYEVKITLPKQYVIAHTGSLIQEKINCERVQYIISAPKVRDFAWFLSETYEVIENVVDGITIKSYHYSPNGIEALAIATKALKTYNELFGKYPYKTLSIAESDFYIGGMEYPQIIQIDSNAYFNGYSTEQIWLEYLIAHEVAHQWWYAVVGNNQIKEPWLDEGLTEYTTILYFEKNSGIEKRDMIIDFFIKSNIGQFEKNDYNSKIINSSINEFRDWQEYSAVIYSRGAMIHHDLRNQLGDKAYFKLLKKYYKEYKFRHATIEKFIKMANETSKEDLQSFFK